MVSPPVAITANTTYIASYHTFQGHFANDFGYFDPSGVNNPPLRALRSGEDGGNGVFIYGDVAFPNNSFSSNYWVDVVFNTTPDDLLPPTVALVFPADAATGIAVNTSVTASFSEAIDPATVNTGTFELRDPSNAVVTAAVSYNVGSKTATFAPATELAESTTYTAILKGGSAGIKDLAGNSLVSDYTWSFTTSVPPPPPADEGPGGPILIVSSESNPFTRYYVEILRNEGLNAFIASDIR